MKKSFASVFAILLPALLAFSVHASSGDISPAIAVLRRNTILNKCGVLGETMSFTRDEYESAVGDELRYITVVTLPGSTEGTLKLNGINVVSGQTVAAGSLDSLTFVPAGAETAHAEFVFRVSAENWKTTDIKCLMTFNTARNLPPVVTAEGVSVYKNTSYELVASAYDPDGDDVKLVIDGYPTSGTLKVYGTVMVYTPKKNFTGSDSIVLHAADGNGAVSARTTYEIKVIAAPLEFADMESSPLHSQAIALAAGSVTDYTQKNGAFYFEPKKTVSRIDLTVMLLSAAGINAETAVSALPFADTDGIGAGKKAYLAKAVSLGITSGETYFRPGDTVTCAEAASFANALIGAERSAAQSYILNALESKGETPLTREDAVRILYCIASINAG